MVDRLIQLGELTLELGDIGRDREHHNMGLRLHQRAGFGGVPEGADAAGARRAGANKDRTAAPNISAPRVFFTTNPSVATARASGGSDVTRQSQ